jgi:AcrR family transcriptional regulator
MILDAAIDYFAENGFSARVRELADNIGVSQSLIFRYFGSKEELIEGVYEKTFLSRWNPEWETILHDQSHTLRERLNTFYRSYMSAVDERRWIRIAMYASLAGRDLTRRYIQGPVTRLISAMGEELQSEKQFGNLDRELTSELVWHIHSTIIYYLIRKHIHGSAVARDRNRVIALVVDKLLYFDKQKRKGNRTTKHELRTRRTAIARAKSLGVSLNNS